MPNNNSIISFPTGSYTGQVTLASTTSTSSYITNAASGYGYIYAPSSLQLSSASNSIPYVNLSLSQRSAVYEYIIPANSLVYADSDSHSQEKLHSILTLGNISHMYNETTKDIALYIDDECVFDESDIIKFEHAAARITNKSSTNVVGNCGIKIKLPKSYFGITHIKTFEYKLVTTWTPMAPV